MISEGEVAEPVHNFRFAHSVLEALASVKGVGRELSAFAPDFGSFGCTVAPALRSRTSTSPRRPPTTPGSQGYTESMHEVWHIAVLAATLFGAAGAAILLLAPLVFDGCPPGLRQAIDPPCWWRSVWRRSF